MRGTSPFLQELIEKAIDSDATEQEVKEVVTTLTDEEACNALEGWFWNKDTKTCEQEEKKEEIEEEVEIDDFFIPEDQLKQELIEGFIPQVQEYFKETDFVFDDVNLLENDIFIDGLDRLKRGGADITLSDIEVYHNYLDIKRSYDPEKDTRYKELVAYKYFEDIMKLNVKLPSDTSEKEFLSTYIERNCAGADNKTTCSRETRTHYKEYIQWTKDRSLNLENIPEELLADVEQNRIKILQRNFANNLYVGEGEDNSMYQNFLSIQEATTQIVAEDTIIHPYLSEETRKKVEKNPALRNSDAVIKEIRNRRYQESIKNLPEDNDFMRAIVDHYIEGVTIGKLNESKLTALLEEVYPEKFHSTVNDKFRWTIRSKVVGKDIIEIIHPSGFRMEVDLEGIDDFSELRKKEALGKLRRNIAKFMSGHAAKDLSSGLTSLWNEIEFKITNAQGESYYEVLVDLKRKERLSILKSAFPDTEEVLLVDMIAYDSDLKVQTPYKYELGNNGKWFRVDGNGRKTPIVVSISSPENKELLAFLTYRYNHKHRSKNGIHSILQSSRMEETFDPDAKENEIFMSSDVDKSVKLLEEVYGINSPFGSELGFTFHSEWDKGIDYTVPGVPEMYTKRKIIATHIESGESIEIEVGFDVKGIWYWGDDEHPQRLQILASKIAQSRSALTSFIDNITGSKVALLSTTNRQRIFEYCYGPGGILQLSEEDEAQVSKELEEVRSQIEIDIGITRAYEEAGILGGKKLEAKEKSKYAFEINTAINALIDGGIENPTKEMIVDFALRILKAKKEDAIREKIFNKWYNDPEGQQKMLFWGINTKHKDKIQRQLNIARTEKRDTLEGEIVERQNKLATEINTIMASPPAQFMDTHESNLADKDHQYQLTNYEIENGLYFRIPEGPYAGKIVPYTVAMAYAQSKSIIRNRMEGLLNKKVEIDNLLDEAGSLDELLDLLDKSYNWGDYLRVTTAASISNSINGILGVFYGQSPMMQEIITKNAITIESWKETISQEVKVSWREIDLSKPGTFGRFVASAIGFGAEQSGNLMTMAATGGVPMLSAIAIGVASGGQDYYQNAAQYYSEHGTLDGFDDSGELGMVAFGVGLANGFAGYFQARFFQNFGAAVKAGLGFRRAVKLNIYETFKALFNARTGLLGSGVVEQFAEVATEIAEGFITGNPLTQEQLVDVWMETGIFNITLGFLPAARNVTYSFLSDKKKTKRIRDRLDEMDTLKGYMQEFEAWMKNRGLKTDMTEKDYKVYKTEYSRLDAENKADLKTIWDAASKFDKIAWRAISTIGLRQESIRNQIQDIKNSAHLSTADKKTQIEELTNSFNELEQVRSNMITAEGNINKWGILSISKDKADIDRKNNILDKVREDYNQKNPGKKLSDEDLNALASVEYNRELIREDDARTPKRTKLAKGHTLVETIEDAIAKINEEFEKQIDKLGDTKQGIGLTREIERLKRLQQNLIKGIKAGNHGANFKLGGQRFSLTVVDNAAAAGKTENRTHETGHTVFIEQLGLDPASYRQLSAIVLAYLKKNHPYDLFMQIQAGVEVYKWNNGNPTNPFATKENDGRLVEDEVIMRFLEFVADGKVDLKDSKNKGLAALMTLFSSKAVSESTGTDFGYMLDGEDGSINFIIQLAKKIKDGTYTREDAKVLNKQTLIQNAKNKIAANVLNIKTENVIKLSEAVRVNSIYEEEGAAGAWKIIEIYGGMIRTITDRYSTVPGFNSKRQILIDDIGTGKRGLFDLINEYDPTKGVPLSAWINKYLRSRAIEIVERTLDFDGVAMEFDENASYTSDLSSGENISSSVRGGVETGDVRKILELGLESDFAKEVIAEVESIIAENPTFNINGKKYRQGLETKFIEAFKGKIRALIGGSDREAFKNFLIKHKKEIIKLIAIKHKGRFKELTEFVERHNVDTSNIPENYVQNPTAGNAVWRIKDISDADFVALFTEGRKGWETMRTSLIEVLAAELGLDATFDAYKSINPENFENNIGYISEAIKRDPNVKFSEEDGDRVYDFGEYIVTEKDVKQGLYKPEEEGTIDIGRWEFDVRSIYSLMQTNEDFLKLLNKNDWTLEGLDFPPAAVAWCYRFIYNPNTDAVSQRFIDKGIKQNKNFADNVNAQKFLEQGPFENNVDAQDDQHNANKVIFDEYLNGIVWEILNGRGFGYMYRGLDNGSYKENTKGPRTDGKYLPKKFKSSHSGKTPLMVQGWDFDYDVKITVNGETYTGAFVGMVNGKRVVSLDPVSQHDAQLITGKYNAGFNNISNSLNYGLDLDIDIDFDAVRIMEKGVIGGIMERYTAIRFGSEETYGKYGTDERKANQIAAIKEMLPEVLAANKANVDLIVTINEAWFNAMMDGKVSGVQYLRFLQLQTNDTRGPKGLSTIVGFHLPKGPRVLIQDKSGKKPGEDGYVETFEKDQGEHMVVNAETGAKAADLFARAFEVDQDGKVIGYKKGFDKASVRNELYKIFNKNSQILIPHSFSVTMDAGPGGKTSSAGDLRINFLDEDQRNSVIAINGENFQDVLVENQLIEFIEEINRDYKIVNDLAIRRQKVIDNIVDKENGQADVQGASVFDFDETLIVNTENFVYAVKEGAETIPIPAAKFVEMKDGLEKQGYQFNFDDFIRVREGEPGPLFQKLKNQIEKYGPEAVYILTARQPGAAVAIHQWLKQNGVDLPMINIHGLGVDPDVVITGKDKANWIEQNLIFNGFNDIYFVDDAIDIVNEVREMFDKYPDGLIAEGGKSVLVDMDQHAKFSEKTNSEVFNIFIEETSGIKRGEKYDASQARLISRSKGLFNYNNIIPYSAEDFRGILYQFLGKGEMGEYQMAWFEEKLLKPYSLGEISIQEAKVEVTQGYRDLKKSMPKIQNKLKNIILREDGSQTHYTVDHAIRVWLWHTSKPQIDIPNLAPRDRALMLKAVQSDPALLAYATRLGLLSGLDAGYIAPDGANWVVDNIASDINNIVNVVGREKHLTEFIKNKDEIFSEENLNKIEVVHGRKFREALENALDRMETGKSQGKAVVKVDRITDNWNNWVNNSVGAVMFLNGRSAVLQTLSTFNYIEVDGPNSILNAANAFNNQEQFWTDFITLWKDKYLLGRRKGEQRGINEQELADRVRNADNKAKAALAYLLELGFTPTRIADSFAIACGGASYVRNYANTIESMISDFQDSGADLSTFFQAQGIFTKIDLDAALEGKDINDLSPEELSEVSWKIARGLWVESTESGQQSSRQDMLSMEQTGGLGRLILAFKNTPMQYTRKILRAAQDLKNGRGNTRKHIQNIAYYSALQNLMFNGLQQALFARLEEKDEDWEEAEDTLIQGMVNSIIGGMGLTGAVVVTVKDGVLEFKEQEERGWNADHGYTILQFAQLSPTIGSKLRKIYGSIKGKQYNEDVIEAMDLWDPQNPAWAAVANLIEGLTNIPTGEIVESINNLLAISADENEWWQNLALLLGWNTWDLDVETKAKKLKKQLKEEKIQKKKEVKISDAQKEVDEQVVKEIELDKKGELKGVPKCSAAKSDGSGRCDMDVKEVGGLCKYHRPETETVVKCDFRKPNGERCKLDAVKDNGRCNTPQHQPGFKRKGMGEVVPRSKFPTKSKKT